MKNRKQILINAFIVIIIACMSLCSCADSATEQEQDQTLKNDELRQIEEDEFTELFMELKNTINEVDLKLGKLCNYSWNSKLGMLEYGKEDQHGVIRSKNVIEIIDLELASDCDTLSDKLSSTRNSISDVWNGRPYHEPQSVIEKMDIQTINEWKTQCRSMGSKLEELQQTIVDFQEHANSVFADLLYAIKYRARSGSLLEYAEMLMNDVENYSELINETMNDLDEACEIANQLQEWEFSTLLATEID
jgi:hypothetical protein